MVLCFELFTMHLCLINLQIQISDKIMGKKWGPMTAPSKDIAVSTQ